MLTRLPHVIVIGVLATVTPLAVKQQSGESSIRSHDSPPAQRSALSGTVADALEDAPVARVVVTLTTASGPGAEPGLPRSTVTDAHGRFVFDDLPARQDYILNASRQGYLPGSFGASVGGGLPSSRSRLLRLDEGEWLGDVRILLWRSGSISGTVIDEIGHPVVDAYVRVFMVTLIAGQEHYVAASTVRSDDRGRYRAPHLSAGRYVVAVWRTEATIPADYVFPFVREAFHDPSQPMLRVPTPDQWEAQIARLPQQPNVDPGDSRGRLLVGRFHPTAASDGGRPTTYPSTFHAGAHTATEASRVELKAGEHRDHVDISLMRRYVARVAGHVTGPREALFNLSLRLVRAGDETLGLGADAATTSVFDEAGYFEFLNVPYGSYWLEARHSVIGLTLGRSGSGVDLPARPGPGFGGTLSVPLDNLPVNVFTVIQSTMPGWGSAGRTHLVVEQSAVEGLELRLSRASTLEGVIDVDGRPLNTQGSVPMTLAAEPASGELRRVVPSVRPSPDGKFRLTGLLPGKYYLRLKADDLVLKSVHVSGAEAPHALIDVSDGETLYTVVSVTREGAAITGRVPVLPGHTGSDLSAICFPADRSDWTGYGFTSPRYAAGSVSSSGAFRVSQLPAGRYFVAVVAIADRFAWHDPHYLGRIASDATSVTVGWGQTVSVDPPVLAR